jgi:hypothetical protein
MGVETRDTGGILLQELDARIAFHKTWQRICMLGYTVPAIVGALASVLATGIAASGRAETAAILSATATGALLVEKTLMLREKWRLHLSVRTTLEMMRVRLGSGTEPAEKLVAELDALLRSYAASLPIAGRAQEAPEPAAQTS